jgi:hypothetical protein
MTRSIRKEDASSLARREFIVAAGAIAVAYAPLSALAQVEPATPQAATPVLLDDWTIDDMWGVYPRYAEPIGYARPRGDGEVIAAVAPVDLGFLV